MHVTGCIIKKHTHDGRSDLTLGDSFRALENGQYHAWIRYGAFDLLVLKLTNCEGTYSPLSNSWVLLDAQQPTRSSIMS